MPLGHLGARLGQGALERPARRAGQRVEDEDLDGTHRASLATVRAPTEGSDGMARPRRTRAYVGLGANLGDAAATLARGDPGARGAAGRAALSASRGCTRPTPVGVTDQPEFRNAVVALDVPVGPDASTGALALLIALKGLERAFGRRRRRRWGPRELDLDLLVFGRARLAVERPAEGRSVDARDDPAKAVRLLVVPHPEARERLFVLAPLADLAPGLVPPGWGETVATARARRAIAEGPDAAVPIAAWDRPARTWQPLD